ncbi:MAG: cupin-like domain-containing protein [Candidatus Rokubacteria bacterium]|nr:cupin-like domain-containing protein [Candidatus Rokubacteria bacterium]
MPLLDRLERIGFSKLPPLSQIPRVVDPPADVVKRYFVDRGSPVIAVGAALFGDTIPTLADMLKGPVQDIRVHVRRGAYGDPFQRREERSMPLVDYVQQYLHAADDGDDGTGVELPYYAGNTPLSRSKFDALGLRYPDAFDEGSFAPPRLWMGPRGSLTPLHYDTTDNLMCQYVGRKHLTLFPPSQIKWLYATGFGPSWSRIPDPRSPDLVKFPLFARARSVEVTLHPGEILFLPAHWSHFVVNLDLSVMANFWQKPTRYIRWRVGAQSLRWRVRRWMSER